MLASFSLKNYTSFISGKNYNMVIIASVRYMRTTLSIPANSTRYMGSQVSIIIC